MPRSITELLLEWQALGEDECFAHLATAIQPLVEKTATRWLKRYGVGPGSRVDEIVCSVLNHLRRLHPRSVAERSVAPFRPEPDGCDAAGDRYVRWLTRRRSQDLVRSERRQLRAQPMHAEAGVIDSLVVARASSPYDALRQEQTARLQQAVESLSWVSRAVVEGLLQGHSQSQMAMTLGVSEGTISRRKARAVQQLRDALGAGQALHPGGAKPRADASAKAAIPRGASWRPCVMVHYRTTSAFRIAIHRHHRWYAFGCVLKGENDLTWVRKGREQKSHQTRGTCNFFSPDDVDDEFLWEPTGEATYQTILVPPEYFEEIAESEGRDVLHGMRPVFGFQDDALGKTILSLSRHTSYGDGLAQECDARFLVVRMLERLGRGRVDWLADKSVFAAKEAGRICAYVDAHLRDQISLQQLAQVPGLSPGHFSRKCHRSFGVTPSRLVSIRRIQRVVDLLRQTDEPMEHIARASGFCTPSHCTNTFRAILGIPPSRFRAELRPCRSLPRDVSAEQATESSAAHRAWSKKP